MSGLHIIHKSSAEVPDVVGPGQLQVRAKEKVTTELILELNADNMRNVKNVRQLQNGYKFDQISYNSRENI